MDGKSGILCERERGAGEDGDGEAFMGKMDDGRTDGEKRADEKRRRGGGGGKRRGYMEEFTRGTTEGGGGNGCIMRRREQRRDGGRGASDPNGMGEGASERARSARSEGLPMH